MSSCQGKVQHHEQQNFKKFSAAELKRDNGTMELNFNLCSLGVKDKMVTVEGLIS